MAVGNEGTGAASGGDRLLEKVRGLLSQAEHPNTSQAEAEAFTAKAAELMAKYGIDAALLADRGETPESVTSLRIEYLAPYRREKAALLGSIAASCGCQSVRHSYGRTVTASTVFGFPADLERVELLYNSLLLQATRDVVRAEVPYWEDPKAYRRSWLHGFAVAVTTRLHAAQQNAQQNAQTGGRSVALVLADRSALVRAAVDRAYPKIPETRRRQLSGGGAHKGYEAGRRADLGGPKVGKRQRGQVGGAR